MPTHAAEFPTAAPIPVGASAPGALVVSESIIDIVAHESGRDTEHRGSTEYLGSTEHLGGSGANVALAIARLGHPVGFLTHLGDDERGQRFLSAFVPEGVHFVAPPTPGTRTSTARATLAADGSASYDFDLTWDIPAIDPSEYAVVHIGSLGVFLDPGSARLLATARSAAAAGAIVTLDPNIRPTLLPDHAAAVARFEEAARLSHVVKLSDEDLGWLYPYADLEVAAQRILDLGAATGNTRAVFVTRGAEGAGAVTAAGVTRILAVRATVVDTIGAGDSFAGSLISSLLEARAAAPNRAAALDTALADPTPLLERAVRVAAFVVARPGAQPPRRSELS